MRQILIQVPKGKKEQVVDLAALHKAVNVSHFTTDSSPGKGQEVVLIHLANDRVGEMLEDLKILPEAYITLDPHAVLPMQPPDKEVAERITNVKRRSALEVWLNGLQSIGSWKSFLAYTVAASVVVWVGLYTNTIFLLVAAMLIAPFGGPVMNISLATASGDMNMLKRSVLRYVLGPLALIVITALLSLIWQLDRMTNLMLQVGQISLVASLLPIVTGAIGAMNLVEPERSSLVSGTAVGLLVAAALTPPAGVAGMAAALGEWPMVFNALYVLLLQMVMINLSGTLVFRYYGGLTENGSRYQRGSRRVYVLSMILAAIAAVGLVFVQVRERPDLQRSTQAQRATTVAEQVIEDSDLVSFVSGSFRFIGPNRDMDEKLLGTLYVERQPGVNLSDSAIKAELVPQVQTRLQQNGFSAIALLSVSVLEGSDQPYRE